MYDRRMTTLTAYRVWIGYNDGYDDKFHFASPAFERRERAQALCTELIAKALRDDRRTPRTYEVREEQIPWELKQSDGGIVRIDAMLLGDDDEWTRIEPGRCYRIGTCA
jgi:hypothetical protein